MNKYSKHILESPRIGLLKFDFGLSSQKNRLSEYAALTDDANCFVYLNNFNGCTACPDLRRALGVPSEGEDIFTVSKMAGNVNNIDDVAVTSLFHAALLHMGVDWVSSPHRAGGIGPISCPLGRHLLPIIKFLSITRIGRGNYLL